MARYISFRDFDWILFVFVLIICGLGVMEIHSATEHTKFAGAHIKQIYWILAGLGAMFLVSLLIHLVFFALAIFMMYKAYQNELFRAPIIGDLAAKQAGL